MNNPPFGYKYKGNRLVKNNDEQIILKAISCFKRAGLTVEEIISRLQYAGASFSSKRARYEHLYFS